MVNFPTDRMHASQMENMVLGGNFELHVGIIMKVVNIIIFAVSAIKNICFEVLST